MIGQLQIPLQTLEHCQSVTITEPLKPGPDRRSVTGSISMRPATPRHAHAAALPLRLHLMLFPGCGTLILSR